MKKTRTFLFLLLVLLVSLALVIPHSPNEESVETILVQHASWEFGERINFEARGSNPLREATIFYQIEGDPGFRFKKAECHSREARITIPLSSDEIPPAASIRYFWQLRDSSGNLFRTDPSEFCYLDQRFAWQSEKQEKITVFWYGEDQDLPEQLFEETQRSLKKIREKLGLEQKEPIKVVVYQDQEEILEMLLAISQKWDRADITVWGMGMGENTITLFWHPDWRKNLPHELTHLLVSQTMSRPSRPLPFWLNEGLACYISPGPHLSSEPKKIAPLPSLNAAPADPEMIAPAYSQARSLVAFLIEEYGGKERIVQLLKAAKTRPLEEAFQGVYGLGIEEFEKAWQKHVEAACQ